MERTGCDQKVLGTWCNGDNERVDDLNELGPGVLHLGERTNLGLNIVQCVRVDVDGRSVDVCNVWEHTVDHGKHRPPGILLFIHVTRRKHLFFFLVIYSIISSRSEWGYARV